MTKLDHYFWNAIDVKNILAFLQCDYCNGGHQDKVDQLDDRKIAVHSKKVSC